MQAFFGALLARDASGSSWLPALLAATRHGEARLGDLLAQPGWLVTPLAVATADGRLGAFTYPATPPRDLLSWYVEHPDALTWPAHAELSAAATRLRRALIDDDPPGAQVRAQERARDLIGVRSALSREWWRFEETVTLDCVLVTDRLVVTVKGAGSGPIGPATDWFPRRSQLVRALEAARMLSTGRQWATILVSDQPLEAGQDDQLSRAVEEGAPHLDSRARAELRAAFLGNLTWGEASAAVETATA